MIDLSAEPDRRIGRLTARPSMGRVEFAGRVERVAPRVMQVLLALAQRPGETLTRDQLVALCWDGPFVSDDAVNRVIAQVRALSRQFDPAPFDLETVPKIGFRLVVPATGPAADETPPASAPAPGPAGGRTRIRPAALLLLGLAAGLALVVWLASRSPGQNGRVEVARFQAPGADPALQHLAGDLSEALVRIASRSGIATAAAAAGADPGAELRIKGAVDRVGANVAVSSQIIDRRSGLVLLSIRMERPAADTAGLSDEVGRGVSAVLQCLLEDRRQARRRLSPPVMALYLNTCDSIAREPNPERMLEAGRRLTAAEPDLAIGQALLAVALAQNARDPDRPPAEVESLRRQARAVAQRALRLDPNTPKAELALAITYPSGTAFAERERHLLRSHEIDPNLNPGRIDYITLLRETGRIHEAVAVARQLRDSGDPRTSLAVLFAAAVLEAQTGRMGEARAIASEAAQHDPGLGRAIHRDIAAWYGPPAEALAAVQPLVGRWPPAACLADYLRILQAGRRPAGLPAACGAAPPDMRVRLLAREGDIDGVFDVLRTADDLRSSPQTFFLPELAQVRADPRFLGVASRLGLVDYWRRSGHAPDFCAGPDKPDLCAALKRPGASP